MRKLWVKAWMTLDGVFDGLAAFIDTHFAPGVLHSLLD